MKKQKQAPKMRFVKFKEVILTKDLEIQLDAGPLRSINHRAAASNPFLGVGL